MVVRFPPKKKRVPAQNFWLGTVQFARFANFTRRQTPSDPEKGTGGHFFFPLFPPSPWAPERHPRRRRIAQAGFRRPPPIIDLFPPCPMVMAGFVFWHNRPKSLHLYAGKKVSRCRSPFFNITKRLKALPYCQAFLGNAPWTGWEAGDSHFKLRYFSFRSHLSFFRLFPAPTHLNLGRIIASPPNYSLFFPFPLVVVFPFCPP